MKITLFRFLLVGEGKLAQSKRSPEQGVKRKACTPPAPNDGDEAREAEKGKQHENRNRSALNSMPERQNLAATSGNVKPQLR